MRKPFRFISAITTSLSAFIWVYIFLENPLKRPQDGDCANTDCVQGLLADAGLFGLLMIVATILLVVALVTFIIARKQNPPSSAS